MGSVGARLRLVGRADLCVADLGTPVLLRALNFANGFATRAGWGPLEEVHTNIRTVAACAVTADFGTDIGWRIV